MADQQKPADKSRSPRSKSMRSQKTMPTAPSEPPPQDIVEELETVRDRTPGPSRSHTPGHLSSKSQDRRAKAIELTIRQRSQTVSQNPLPVASPTTSIPPIPPPLQRDSSTSSTLEVQRASPSQSSSRDDPSRQQRPPNYRSTSAIAQKPAAVQQATQGLPSAPNRLPTPSQTSTTAPRVSRTPYIAAPPLPDPKTAPNVQPAPASGMYWSRAPVSGASHTNVRAHTTTLIGSNIYVFGGCDSRSCFNELYVLDADAFYWSSPYVCGEIPVPLRAMTCTAVGKKLIVFGGGDGPAYYNDVYVLDTVNFRWSKPRIGGDSIPSTRRAHTACLYKSGIYVFGGGDGARALNDVWRLDVSDINKMSWKLISSPSNPSDDNGRTDAMSLKPKARGYHTANMVGSKLIIFGGSDGEECFNDVWVFDVETRIWRPVNIPIAYPRLSHTATIVGSYLFVIGGHDGSEYTNEVLLLNLVTMVWDKRKIYGKPPSGRGYHGTVLHDSRLVVIGGLDGNEVFGDVYILELAVHAYYSQISHFTIDV
ncbi:hypothetical protein F5884DRAFT_673026 [Xylogone sp. PMI_703]|nr:hypothetical protein F5884DRAFT_673026 [Xylogone sp. PMI_703]